MDISEIAARTIIAVVCGALLIPLAISVMLMYSPSAREKEEMQQLEERYQ